MQTRQHFQSTKLRIIDNAAYLENIKIYIKALKASATPDFPKTSLESLRESIDTDALDPSDNTNLKTNEIIYVLFDSSSTGFAYKDVTGRFF